MNDDDRRDTEKETEVDPSPIQFDRQQPRFEEKVNYRFSETTAR